MRPLILILCICVALTTRGEADARMWSYETEAPVQVTR